ncbi:MAG: acetate--CoA ligase family protein [Betaproteobacteria bacterium]|nr:acetate--CoA ligase family protein [Betaproteobacteria bacterium]
MNGVHGHLRIALNPKSIAIVGASENPNKVGGRPLQFLRRYGFKGAVYPINPSRETTQGVRSFRRLADLPEAPDLAIIAVAGAAAIDALEECGAAGVMVAIVMSSGFSESDPVGGKEVERRMVERARAQGMRIIGPNSQGIANFGNGAIASFSTMFAETEPADGPVGIVGQSGAISAAVYGLLRHRGVGVRYANATGNDSDVTACEMACAVAEDPDLKLLLLYLEGMPDPHHLARAARIAREHDLPVIAVKSGRSEAGQAAARSHTGALASEDRVVDAFFEEHGILRACDMAELIAGAEIYVKGWRPAGRRLAAMSNSGAVCVLSADAAAVAGMTMAKLLPETEQALKAALPSFANAANPVDLTGALLTDGQLFGRALSALARDPEVDAYLIGLPVAGAGYDVELFARQAWECASSTGKPVVVAAPQQAVSASFRARGLPVFQFETEAVDALGRFMAHLDLMQRARRRPARQEMPPPARLGGGAKRMCNESDSLAIVAAAGVPVVPHRLCRTVEEALEACHALGGPVAAKGCSSEVTHKSELGIVDLNLPSEEAVRESFQRIAATLAARGLAFDGVIIARMVKGCRELMIGAHRDPVFGPVIAFGDGGKYVEAMPDVRVLLPTATREDVMRALHSLRIAPVLRGVRGEPPMDIDAFIDAVLAVAGLMTRADASIESLDINPVVVGESGKGCAAVDAVVFTVS